MDCPEKTNFNTRKWNGHKGAKKRDHNGIFTTKNDNFISLSDI